MNVVKVEQKKKFADDGKHRKAAPKAQSTREGRSSVGEIRGAKHE